MEIQQVRLELVRVSDKFYDWLIKSASMMNTSNTVRISWKFYVSNRWIHIISTLALESTDSVSTIRSPWFHRSCSGSTLKAVGGAMGTTPMGDAPSIYVSQVRSGVSYGSVIVRLSILWVNNQPWDVSGDGLWWYIVVICGGLTMG